MFFVKFPNLVSLTSQTNQELLTNARFGIEDWEFCINID